MNDLMLNQLPKLQFFKLDNLNHIGNMQLNLVPLIIKIQSLIDNYVNYKGLLGSRSRIINVVEYTINCIKNNSNHFESDKVHDMDIYYNNFFNKMFVDTDISNVPTKPGFGKMTLEQLEDFLPALHAHQKCHILFDTYVKNLILWLLNLHSKCVKFLSKSLKPNQTTQLFSDLSRSIKI